MECSVEEEEEEEDIEMRSGRSKRGERRKLLDEQRENKHLCAHILISINASRCDKKKKLRQKSV